MQVIWPLNIFTKANVCSLYDETWPLTLVQERYRIINYRPYRYGHSQPMRAANSHNYMWCFIIWLYILPGSRYWAPRIITVCRPHRLEWSYTWWSCYIYDINIFNRHTFILFKGMCFVLPMHNGRWEIYDERSLLRTCQQTSNKTYLSGKNGKPFIILSLLICCEISAPPNRQNIYFSGLYPAMQAFVNV